ncbi:MAG: PAS domain S-box protein [Geothrix sp.]|uniref:PAS domain S-box protein n=1 Tax=Geothrix sp. TaxID=1962974 RepID=UPI003BB18C0D
MPETIGQPASWSSLFEALPQGVLLLDREGRYVEANAAALKLLELDRRALLDQRLGEGRWAILATDGSVLPLEETPGAVVLRTGKAVHRHVVGVVKPDGDVLWLEISAEPTAEGGALVSFDDITRHHLAESILAARARIAELAATSTLEQILRATLDEAERLTGSCIGFFHFMEEDQETLTLQAWSTRTQDEFCQAEGHGMHYAVDKAGVWVDAVHARKPVIHNDYASLPHKKGMPEGHATVLRELVVPVLREERIVALLGVGNKPFPYGNRDLQTVQRLADLAWDIAERKRSEVALHQSEADYRTLFESMAQGAFRQRADGSLLDVNLAALELFGLSRDEFLGRTSLSPAWDVISEAGEPFTAEDHPSMKALRTGKPVLGQVLGVTNQRTGVRVWLEVSAIPEFHPGEPAPYRAMVTLHDLTERRRLEASLKESEARWHTLVEQAGDGLELLDENGRYLQVNEASCRALGYTREELLGLSVMDTDPNVTLEGYQARFTALIGQPAVTFETTHRRKDGTQFPAEVTVSVIRIGDHHRALAQVRDISERTRAGEALRAAKELLDQTLDSLEAHVAVLDGAANIIAVNEPWRRFARANGIRDTVGTVEQVNYLEVMASSCQNSAGDTTDIRQGLVDVLSGNRPSFVAEYPCDSPTETRWFRMHIQPLLAAQGGAVITHENITDEKLAQVALEQAHEQLAFAQRAAGAGLWEWDLVSGHFTWSPELFRLYGLDPDQDRATPETWRRILHPDDLKAVEAHTEKVIAERTPFANDYRVVLPDGQIRWIRGQGAFDLDAQGRPIRMAGICLDHTMQNQAEQAMADSEAKARAMLQTARDAVWLMDLEGRFRDVNEAACRMLGYSREALLQLSLVDIEAQEDDERARQHVAKIASQGWDVFESEHRRRDGSVFPVEISVTHQSNLDQMVVFVRNITERRQAEEALQVSEQRLRQAMGVAGLGIWEWDPKTDRTEWFGEMFSIYGVERGDFTGVGSDYMAFTRPDYRDLQRKNMEEAWNRAVTEPEFHKGAPSLGDLKELCIVRPDGSEAYTLGSAICIVDESGQPLRMLGITLDITERKKAARTLETSQRFLADTERVSHVGGWEIDLDSQGLTWTEEVYRIHELDPDHHPTVEQGMTFYEEGSRPVIEAAVQHAIEHGQGFELELGIRTAKGNLRQVHVIGKVDPSRRRVFGFIQDITERKTTEMALRESETRFRAMFEDSPIGIWEEDFSQVKAHLDALRHQGVVDFRAHFAKHPGEVAHLASLVRVLRVNRASLLSLKAGNEAELVRNLQDYFTPDSLETFKEELCALVDGQTRFRLEGPHLDAHGQHLVFEISFAVQPGCEETLDRVLVSFVDITERKAIETALRESETRLKEAFRFNEQLLATMPIGAVAYDGETGRCLLANEAIAQVVGGTRDQLLQQSFRDLGAWRTSGLLEMAERVLASGVDEQLEVRLTSTFDKEVWLAAAFSTFSSQGRRILLALCTDVSERKEGEQALLEAEWKFRALFDNGPLGVAYHRMVYDETGRPVDYVFIDANANYIELTGVDPRGRLVTEAFPGIEKDSFDWIGTFGKVARTGERIRFEQYLETNGRWYDCVGYQYKPDHFVAAFLEITKRKLAELALQDSEARFRGYVENAPVGVFICDETGRYLQVNPAASAITGYAEAELLGMHLSNLVPEDQLDLATRRFEQVAVGGKVSVECAFLRKDGRQGIWALESVQLSPNRFMGLVSDITEQKQAEKERLQLEQQVARTQKMESLGSLAGGVAHDMNNVLGAIMGLASIHQEQEPEGSRLRKSMDTILKACTRGRTLVKGLLGFARKGLEEVRILDLNEVVREDAALLERTIPANIRIDLDLAEGLRPIHGDPSSLSHVLMNLCVNAMDAMPEGGTLRVATRNLDPDLVSLEVADTGCGMPPDVLEKALDPFFTTKVQGKGTGLGLAIVYGTVKAHHGRLEITSTVGVGTRVSMEFPATLLAVPTGTASPADPRVHRPMNILVIDDDELIQITLAELLRSMGHVPTLAASGEEALQCLEEGLRVEAVLLDLNMPGLGGAGTLPLLRAAYPDLPVLLATGRADQSAMDLVARHARTLLLPKPFSAEEVASHLRQLCLD